jgi:hypothetical protein
MKFMIIAWLLLGVLVLDAVTAEALYGPGFAYHTHTAYALHKLGIS